MTNVKKENIKNIENEIFKLLNSGVDKKALRQMINDKEFSKKLEEFVNHNNTSNETKDSSSGVTFNVYNNNSPVLENPFFWVWLSSSSSPSHHSNSNSSNSGCIGDFSSNGDGDGEGLIITIMTMITVAYGIALTNADGEGLIIIMVIVACANAVASYCIYDTLSEMKDNEDKIFGSLAAFTVQAAIFGGLIFFIIKANEIVFDQKKAGLCQALAGINAFISAFACIAFLACVISALYERHQNSKIAKEYAELVMGKLMSEENPDQEPNIPPPPPGFIIDEQCFNQMVLLCTKEGNPDQELSASPPPPGLIYGPYPIPTLYNTNHSIHTGRDGMPPSFNSGYP